MPTNKLQEAGIGLLQVLLAMGLVSAAATVILKSFEDSKKDSKGREFKVDAQDYTAQIFQLLADRTACFHTFNGKNATSSSVASIKDPANSERMVPDTEHGTTLVKLSTIKLEDLPGTSDGVQVVPGGTGFTRVVLSFKERDGTFYRNREYVQKIKLRVKTDASSMVTACYAVGEGVDSVWKMSGEDIYYDNGKVGLGTDSPALKLDVKGPVASSNELGDSIAVGGSATAFEISTATTKPVNFLNSASGKGANLQMGSLKADGVRIVPSSVPCTGSLEGGMRYKASINQLQLCNGSKWMDFVP